MGPFEFQPDVFASVPGDDDYSPLRTVALMSWHDEHQARELASAGEIQAAADAGARADRHRGQHADPDLARRATLMVGFIDRDALQRLVDEHEAVIAKVLPRAEYDWAHLPNAIHLPLKGWETEQIQARLDRDRPVIVYCNDYQ
jgi:hypothetical protein